MLPTGRSKVWIRVLQHISLRGGSFGFKPPPPTGHYFQPLKCFLSLDTFGKFWKIPQEGDWARRAPFLMPLRKHSTKCLPSKTAQPRNPTLKAGEPWQTEAPSWEEDQWRTLGVLYSPCANQRTCVDPVSQGPPEKQDSPQAVWENLMLRTSYKCAGRVERKIEDSEANQRLVTVRSHPIPRAGATMEEVLSLEPRGGMTNSSSRCSWNHKGILKEEPM